jgi:hypothetical protein
VWLGEGRDDGGVCAGSLSTGSGAGALSVGSGSLSLGSGAGSVLVGLGFGAGSGFGFGPRSLLGGVVPGSLVPGSDDGAVCSGDGTVVGHPTGGTTIRGRVPGGDEPGPLPVTGTPERPEPPVLGVAPPVDGAVPCADCEAVEPLPLPLVDGEIGA